MLTTLLPSFPVLRDFDARLLRLFHKMGAIPFGAVRWAQQMDAARFTITEHMLADTKNYIANSARLPDLLIDELRPDDVADRTRFRFTRSLALYVALRNMRSRARFGDDFPDDMAAFEKKMSSFFAQSIGFFALAGQLARQQLEPIDDSIEEFRKLTLESYEEIRLMLARMLLYSCNNEADMAHKLASLGFAIQRPSPVRVPLNLLCFDAIGVVGLFAASTFLSTGPQMPVGKAFAIGLIVAVNHTIAATFALLPKQMWSFADIRCAGERPVLAYVISGLCALTVSLPVMYGFYLLRLYLPMDGGPVMPFIGQCKWLLLSTVMAVALAFACDDFSTAEREPRWLRWVESVALAGVMGLIGVVVLRWLQIDQVALHPQKAPPSLWIPVLLNASLGALFGATIPNWYRKTMRQAKACRPRSVPADDRAPAFGAAD